MASSNYYMKRAHVTPGIYTQETDLTYATNSLGITALGIAGETKKGPAFQPIMVSNWAQYSDYFGGTDPTIFKESKYPKYELPYIAKSYLSESNHLQVVRTLGLSGANAGPAWVITASKYLDNGSKQETFTTKDENGNVMEKMMYTTTYKDDGSYTRIIRYFSANGTEQTSRAVVEVMNIKYVPEGEQTPTEVQTISNFYYKSDYDDNGLTEATPFKTVVTTYAYNADATTNNFMGEKKSMTVTENGEESVTTDFRHDGTYHYTTVGDRFYDIFNLENHKGEEGKNIYEKVSGKDIQMTPMVWFNDVANQELVLEYSETERNYNDYTVYAFLGKGSETIDAKLKVLECPWTAEVDGTLYTENVKVNKKEGTDYVESLVINEGQDDEKSYYLGGEVTVYDFQFARDPGFSWSLRGDDSSIKYYITITKSDFGYITVEGIRVSGFNKYKNDFLAQNPERNTNFGSNAYYIRTHSDPETVVLNNDSLVVYYTEQNAVIDLFYNYFEGGSSAVRQFFTENQMLYYLFITLRRKPKFEISVDGGDTYLPVSYYSTDKWLFPYIGSFVYGGENGVIDEKEIFVLDRQMLCVSKEVVEAAENPVHPAIDIIGWNASTGYHKMLYFIKNSDLANNDYVPSYVFKSDPSNSKWSFGMSTGSSTKTLYTKSVKGYVTVDLNGYNFKQNGTFKITDATGSVYTIAVDTKSNGVSHMIKVASETIKTVETTQWSVDPNNEYNDMVIAVIRSRGEYKKAAFVTKADPENGICDDQYAYDKLVYYADDVTLEPTQSLSLNDNCKPAFTAIDTDGDGQPDSGFFDSSALNYGVFTFNVTTNTGETKKYAVSLNEGEQRYIYNVLGGNQEEGESEIYVEELYDVALKQLVQAGKLNGINIKMAYYSPTYLVPRYKNVDAILTAEESTLRRKDVGKRFLFSAAESVNSETGTPLTVHTSKDKGQTWVTANGKPGHIYTVHSYITREGTREYYYCEYLASNGADSHESGYETEYLLKDAKANKDGIFNECVYVTSEDLYYTYRTVEGVGADIVPVSLDFNNYKEQYRYASTPWIVSEVKGTANNIELHKLFRFHTISDGATANNEVKVSIENIDPSMGTFDVVIRDFYDTDASPVALERYKQCSLVPSDSHYIGLRIGTFDEKYENRSKYVTVEINDDELTEVSIPAGFMGYPIRNYDGVFAEPYNYNEENKVELTAPYFKYNTEIDPDIRPAKQYFGISNLTGLDEDILRYKGVEAYNDVPAGLSPCFHLDSRILEGKPDINGYVAYKDPTNVSIKQRVSIDGVDGYTWSVVSTGSTNITDEGVEPRIGEESLMMGSIYEDKRYRKFTVAFYGGWDGWDYYRRYRTNTDDFTYQRYKGNIDYTSGVGTSLSRVEDPSVLGFEPNEKILNSDYYAYLAAIKQLANPKSIELNLLATPGIDYVNNKLLVDDVIELVEEERGDTLYIVTTPDKPFGYGDTESEMFSPQDAVWNLEDSEIDTNYAATYYPWVKYYDNENSMYIYLPPTRDAVRNFAYTDNTAYPWFAAAGWNRGSVNGVRPKKTLKLAEQDVLYNGRINFVNTFAGEGMKLWGDKNLQKRESQMNRISKRRLLLRLRKQLENACVGLLFDPNDGTAKQSFISAVTPVLDSVKSNRGITDYRVQVDDSVEARERLELPAVIFIKPTPTLEYITINFVITPQGVSFDDV